MSPPLDRRPIRGWTLLTLVASLVLISAAGCTPPPTPLTARQLYIQRRVSNPFIDRRKPCQIARVPPFPVKVAANHVFVPVAVNGVSTVGELDTGSAVSLVTPEIAEAAHLTPGKGRAFTARGATGNASAPPVIAEKFNFGSIALTGHVPLHVLAFGGSNHALMGALIGQDLLDGLDYDIDLKHNAWVPYRTSNCLAIDPPWQDTFTGLAITRGAVNGAKPFLIDLATKFSLRLGTSVPVFFGGQSVEALFDTGAGISMLSRRAARFLGVTDAMLDADPVIERIGMNGQKAKFRKHVFADMTIGEDNFHDFPIAVIPESDRRDTFQMVLAMDYIATRHLWLSYTTNALYIDSGEKARGVPKS